jgi:hypothetical protein
LKTHRNLYPKVCDWDNLYLAYRKARKGKRGRPPAATFEYDLEANLVRLQQELIERTYKPGKYYSFYIHEPKRRLISAAPLKDRVVHHALGNVIEPIFERSFIYDSYANRVGKGTHRAVDRAQQFARRFRYVLQVDLRQFFPSIDHAILRDFNATGRVKTGAEARNERRPDLSLAGAGCGCLYCSNTSAPVCLRPGGIARVSPPPQPLPLSGGGASSH